jgi:long-chain acyl-CoA synthetase
MPSKFVLKELARYNIGTYADIIYRNALLYSDELAFKYGSETVNFAEFNARVNSLIHALRSMGVKKGDVLGILAWNCTEFTYVYGAAMKGGFIASPFNCRLQADELDYLINYSEASTLFVGPEFVEMANQLRPRIPKVKNFISLEGAAPDMTCLRDLLAAHPQEEPDVLVEEDDPVFIFYTSGTTGVPRGAFYDHRRAIDDTRTLVIGLGVEPGDKYVQIMPLFHAGGAKQALTYFYVGGSCVMMTQRSFDAKATLQTLQDEKATDIHIVATHLAVFLTVPDVEKYDLSHLKRVWYAASPMPLELLKKAMKIWGPIFIEGYGSTEDGPNISMLTRKQHDVLDKPPEEQGILTSAGLPDIGVQVRIVDDKDNDVEPGIVGEIAVKSKHNMIGWWHKPEETGETVVNGWLHTGDMGRYDEKGYIYIVDRKRDMICSGGENIYPREIEEVIYQHPSVVEAAVIGIPDPYWVEKVHAVVALKKGASLTAQELIDFCKQKLARFKAPKSVEFVDALPKNPAGKILKRELRDRYWAGLERKV